MFQLRRIPFSQVTKNVEVIFGRRLATVKNNIVTSGLEDIQIPNCTIPQYLFENIPKFDKHIALKCAETGRQLTYLELRKKSKNFGRSLRKKLKLNPGDVIALFCPNLPEFPLATLGALDARLIVTTVSPVFTADEISRQLSDADAKAIITTVALSEIAQKGCNILKKQLPIITIKTKVDQSTPQGTINFREFCDNEVDISDLPPGNSSDLAFLPYSSGTTGLPKGVELSHYNMVSNILQVGDPRIKIPQPTTDAHQDVVPAVLPFYHIYGLQVICLSLLNEGCKLLTLPKFTPDLFISTLKNNQCTLQFVVPPIVLFMTACSDLKPKHFEKMIGVMSGAAPLGSSDEERFVEKFGDHILMLQGYGLTESSPVISNVCRNHKLKYKEKVTGSVGFPIPNTEVKFVDPNDPTFTPLGPNENGELLARGPQIMVQYHNRPEESRKTVTEDGWLRTGDLGYYNEEGIMYVTDRLKELIKVKGFQVAPAELEELIRTHPDVSDVAVIGIPHDISGEVPKAFIVAKNQQTFDSEKVLDFVKEKVAPYKKIAGGIEVVSSIPKNASGKILRRVLKEEYLKSVQR